MESKIKTSHMAFIPARAGSERVPGKNIMPLAGHSLIAYTICAAKQSGIYDRVIVSTDSEKIKEVALYYGAEVVLRPVELASSTSPDIEWINHLFSVIGTDFEAFSILRPTSPLRLPSTIQRAWEQFKKMPEIDSLRAVELCHQHPGKMWVLEGNLMKPLLDQSHLEVAWHASQYKALPKVYVQNSSLEIARTKSVVKYNTREGKIIAPFLTDKYEGFAIDYPSDVSLVEYYLKNGETILPKIDKPPFKNN